MRFLVQYCTKATIRHIRAILPSFIVSAMEKKKACIFSCATQNNLIAEACYCHSKEHLFNQMHSWNIILNFTISIFQRKVSVPRQIQRHWCIKTTWQSSCILLLFLEMGWNSTSTTTLGHQPPTANHTYLRHREGIKTVQYSKGLLWDLTPLMILTLCTANGTSVLQQLLVGKSIISWFMGQQGRGEV